MSEGKCEICRQAKMADCGDDGICYDVHDGLPRSTGFCPNLWRHIQIKKHRDNWPIPRRYLTAFLGQTPHGVSSETRAAIQSVHKQASEALEARRNCIIQGDYGIGKTHILAAVANQCWDRLVPAIFTTSVEALSRLRDTMDYEIDEQFQDLRDELSSVDVLCLDDYGKQRGTQFANEALWDILNDRYNNRLCTMISTNLTSTAIKAQGDEQCSILDRLIDGATVIAMESIRLRRPDGG